MMDSLEPFQQVDCAQEDGSNCKRTSWTAAAQSVCLKVTAKGVEMTV